MAQKIIIENRSTWTLLDVMGMVGDALRETQNESPRAFGHGSTLAWESGEMLTVLQNKESTRFVLHHNDGVDHQEVK